MGRFSLHQIRTLASARPSRTLLWVIVGLAVCLKLVAIPLGSYPFDFASYVYQPRGYFDYGLNPMFYWNKGWPLLSLFYASYSFYIALLHVLGGAKDNVLLLHIAYKLPLFILDILVALLICKIINLVTAKKDYGYLGAALWLVNPLVTWNTEVHGQYSIVLLFFVLLSIYFLLSNKVKTALIFLAGSVSVYYYTALFFPFFLIYTLRGHAGNAKPFIRNTVVQLMVFGAALAACFSLFLLNPVYLKQLFGNLINHSAPDAPSNASVVQMPDFSLFKAPYYWIKHTLPTSLSAPGYFKIFSYTTLLVIVGVAVYAAWRLYKHVVKGNRYDAIRLLSDLVLVTAAFLLFEGKTQKHYVLWILPLLLIVALVQHAYRTVSFWLLTSLAALIATIGQNNVGIYLLDVVPWGTANFWLGFTPETRALAGFTVMLLVAATVYFCVRPGSGDQHEDPVGYKELRVGIYGTMGLLCVIFVILFGRAWGYIAVHGTPHVIASESAALNYPFTDWNVKSTEQKVDMKPVAVPDGSFENIPDATVLNHTGYLGKTSPWHFYEYGRRNVASAGSATDQTNGSRYLSLTAVVPNATGAINMGTSAKNLIPVQPDRLYRVSGRLRTMGNKSGGGKFAVRFADKSGTVIPASDQTIAYVYDSQSWGEYSRDIPSPPGAYYMEATLALSKNDKGRLNGGFEVDMSGIAVAAAQIYTNYAVSDIQRNKPDFEIIKSQILETPAAKDFVLQASIPKLAAYQDVQATTFNGCSPTNRTATSTETVLNFSATCYLKGRGNPQFSAILVNLQPGENIDFSLNHVLQPRPLVKRHARVLSLLAVVYVAGIVAGLVYIKRLYKRV